MFNDPLSLTGKTGAGALSLPRINIDAGIGEFSKFSDDSAAKAVIRHTSFKQKGASSETQRHSLIVSKTIKRAVATSPTGFIKVPYNVYIVIEHDDNGSLSELAEVVANVTEFLPTDSTDNLSKLMNKEV